MIDAAILDRDYVIVRQQATALNGEIIVAMTEENERQSKGFSKKMVTLGFNLRTQPWSQLLFSM
jgi:SOS-response transcriptional repressor LexA